ncbi:hypothetical protein F0562_011407 [Nyssa sinensis]|uniref:RING-CH-type domain-containing protein n=1 Tax=Nyssa sinensis TaxID=561372 RepID=A0A5J5A1K2_9ASTE|nr:hypothetical protein F0562_011407 [Nyssa sinensis]
MEPEIHDKIEGEDTENSTNPVGVIGIEVEHETIIAIKSEDTEIVSAEDGDLSPKTEILQRSEEEEEEEEEGKGKEPKLDTNDCVINVTPEPEPGSGSPGGESLREEKVCRICHLSSEMSESLELIQLGCCCKGELGVSHRQCAETWFKHRGNSIARKCKRHTGRVSPQPCSYEGEKRPAASIVVPTYIASALAATIGILVLDSFQIPALNQNCVFVCRMKS